MGSGVRRFIPVPYGRNLFCSGHVQLPDGRTLIVGGTSARTTACSTRRSSIPRTRTYTRGADMSVRRWYPTATSCPTGACSRLAGDNIVLDVRALRRLLGRVGRLAALGLQPGHERLDRAPGREADVAAVPLSLRPLGRRSSTPARTRRRGSSTPPRGRGRRARAHRRRQRRHVPADKIMKSGTWADRLHGADELPHGRDGGHRHERVHARLAGDGPDGTRRSYHNLTLLPDGKVLASGGGTRPAEGRDRRGLAGGDLGPRHGDVDDGRVAQERPRLYHSTALLLPDGRVLMAGGGALRARRDRPEKRRDLLAAVPVQGSAADDPSAPSACVYARASTSRPRTQRRSRMSR